MSARRYLFGQLPWQIWLIAATSAVVMSGFGMIVPLIPVYGERLGATAFDLGLLMSAFFVGRLLAQLPAGASADRLGRRSVLILALAGYTGTCVGYAMTSGPVGLIVFRLLQGLASGFFGVAARALLNDLCGPDSRGTAQGIYSSSVNFGFFAGPVLGSVTANHLTIHAPFWIAAALSAVALITLVIVPVRAPSRQAVSTTTRPRILPKPWSYRRVRLLAGANFGFMAGLAVIMTLFPIVGKAEVDGGMIFVGAALTIAGFFGLLTGPLMGRLSDVHGRWRLMFLGALLTAAEGTALLLTRNPWWIAGGFALGGIGAAAFLNSLHASIGDLSTAPTRGMATGFAGLAGQSGGIVGSLLAPWIWSITDLAIPFGLQLGATALTVVLIIQFSRIKTARSSRPAEISEATISS